MSDENKNLDICWKQRFENFQKVFEIFGKTIQRVKKLELKIIQEVFERSPIKRGDKSRYPGFIS